MITQLKNFWDWTFLGILSLGRYNKLLDLANVVLAIKLWRIFDTLPRLL